MLPQHISIFLPVNMGNIQEDLNIQHSCENLRSHITNKC